jgi:hypothetical protein
MIIKIALATALMLGSISLAFAMRNGSCADDWTHAEGTYRPNC